jgi:hypothetical protein
MSMLKNQIAGLYRQGASVEEISEALEVDKMVVKTALAGSGGLARKAIMDEEEDVSENEAKEMIGIVMGIARDEEAGVYAQLNAAKYAHGVKRGYHRVHSDLTLGNDELFLRLNEAYQSGARRAREALLNAQAVEIPPPKPLENHIDFKTLEKLEVVQAANCEQPAAQDPGPFSGIMSEVKPA